MISLDGTPLCKISEEKMNWYVKRDLAVIESSNPHVIRLKFNPKDINYIKNEYNLVEKENICCVCGTSHSLNKHHVVPKCYRKLFPKELKSRNHHDVLMICESCHKIYEKYSAELKNNMAEKCGFLSRSNPHLLKVKKAAIHLTNSKENSFTENSLRILRDFLKKENIEADDIVKALDINVFTTNNNLIFSKKSPFEAVVESCENLQDFVDMWRAHFVEKMNPKFLPKGWDPKRSIYNYYDRQTDSSSK